MRKLLALILCGILSQHLYSNLTTIVEIDRDTDIVYCEDFNGYVWSFTGAEDWETGDLCNLVMYDNMTEKVYDDVIVRTIYERIDH